MKELTPPQVFGLRLKQARKAARLSQESLAGLAGYSESTIRQMETNPTGSNSRIQTVFDLAEALKVPPAFLLGLENRHGS